MPGGHRRSVAVLAAGLLVAAAAACSGNDDDSATAADEGDAAADQAPADVEPVASAGCDGQAVSPGGDQGGEGAGGGAGAGTQADERITLQSGGEERWYLRHLPPSYDGQAPLPLVVDIHGYAEGAEVHTALSGLGPYGDEQGFVTLTPHGRGEVPRWEVAPDGVDVAFIGDLLDHADQTLCVDLARVYVTGLSNGAMMTSMVACVYADRFAAAAPVAGVAEVGDCEPERAVPVVGFHGTEDPILSYEGGFGPGLSELPSPDGEGTLGDRAQQEPDQQQADQTTGEGPSVPEVMAGWAERNGCDDEAPEESAEADDVTVLTYPCPEGAEVELYRIDGGGHTWPGSRFLEGIELVGHTTFSISANEVMWAFFEDHPLPG